MVSKNISVSQEAYALLSSERRPGESFSDVVIRLGREHMAQIALTELVGILQSQPNRR